MQNVLKNILFFLSFLRQQHVQTSWVSLLKNSPCACVFCCLMCKKKKVNFVHAERSPERSGISNLQREKVHTWLQKNSCDPLLRNSRCACVFIVRMLKNETFVCCRTFLRTFFELHLLAFDLQASRTKPTVSSFHKTSHVRVFFVWSARISKLENVIWRMFLRTFLLFLSFWRQTHMM